MVVSSVCLSRSFYGCHMQNIWTLHCYYSYFPCSVSYHSHSSTLYLKIGSIFRKLLMNTLYCFSYYNHNKTKCSRYSGTYLPLESIGNIYLNTFKPLDQYSLIKNSCYFWTAVLPKLFSEIGTTHTSIKKATILPVGIKGFPLIKIVDISDCFK